MCKPLISGGLQKLSEKVSTHLLTVLTISCIVIVSIEQMNYLTRYKRKISQHLYVNYYSQSKCAYTVHLQPGTVNCENMFASPQATLHAQMPLL